MKPPTRPRRSALYVPGASTRALEKAKDLPCDVLLLDLEDAVAPEAKEAARANVLAAVAERPYGPREVVVRVNGLDTPWGEADMRAVAGAPVDAVLLPKAERPEDVRHAEAFLTAAAAPGPLALWLMVETPRGVLAADALAGAHPRVATLVAGTSDLVKDLRARHTPDRLAVLTSLSLVVLAARANGLAALDGVHLALDDEAGFEAACRQGRALGFDGKTLIHPRTIAAANRLFSPEPGEVEAARRLLAAWDAARAEGKGVAVVDGRLVEALHAEEARRLLALAG